MTRGVPALIIIIICIISIIRVSPKNSNIICYGVHDTPFTKGDALV